MKLTDLHQLLSNHRDSQLEFILPDGTAIPAHAHVSDVARIDKRFIDCGGTIRSESWCRLQTWVADDVSHRLVAGKLHKILQKALPILGSDDLDVDVEHESVWISQFPIVAASVDPNRIRLMLGVRHTECLAEDQCKPATTTIGFKSLPRKT